MRRSFVTLEADIHRLRHVLFVAYFLEAGLVLIVVPWSAFWDRNVFVQYLPLVAGILTNNFARGAVSGLGVITAFAGLVELAALMAGRRDARARMAVAAFEANRTESRSS